MGDMDSALISSLYSEIAGLSAKISENNEKIARLQKAAGEISSEQAVAMENKKWVQQPELTAELWTGRHADIAVEIRETITKSYSYTFETMVERMLTDIEEKIRKLQSENDALVSSIAAKNQSLNIILSK